jgi:DMSO/TMAO reductase YedYZ molybdopterin-dependent catalytic subunit
MAQPDIGAWARGERDGRGLGVQATGLDGPVIDDPLRPAEGHPCPSPSQADDAPDPRDSCDRADADAGSPTADDRTDCGQQPVLPPGQYIPRTMPVLHYGPIPAFHRDTWDFKIFGATQSGADASLRWDDVAALPVSEVTADFHCVTKFTVPGVHWAGILASELMRRYPPAAEVTHVMIWAALGYSANIRIADFAAEGTVLATHQDGDLLTPEHGYPLRLVVPHLYAWKSVKWIRALEYLTRDRRGFWEERGYHNTADPWREQRYSYQETEGEGPPL